MHFSFCERGIVLRSSTYKKTPWKRRKIQNRTPNLQNALVDAARAPFHRSLTRQEDPKLARILLPSSLVMLNHGIAARTSAWSHHYNTSLTMTEHQPAKVGRESNPPPAAIRSSGGRQVRDRWPKQQPRPILQQRGTRDSFPFRNKREKLISQRPRQGRHKNHRRRPGGPLFAGEVAPLPLLPEYLAPPSKPTTSKT